MARQQMERTQGDLGDPIGTILEQMPSRAVLQPTVGGRPDLHVHVRQRQPVDSGRPPERRPDRMGPALRGLGGGLRSLASRRTPGRRATRNRNPWGLPTWGILGVVAAGADRGMRPTDLTPGPFGDLHLNNRRPGQNQVRTGRRRGRRGRQLLRPCPDLRERACRELQRARLSSQQSRPLRQVRLSNDHDVPRLRDRDPRNAPRAGRHQFRRVRSTRLLPQLRGSLSLDDSSSARCRGSG